VLRIAPNLTRSDADGQYWLDHCEGFHVKGPNGFSGIVEAVRYEPDSGAAAQLVVCSGRLFMRSVVIPADEVALITPRAMRLRLRHTPEAAAAAAPRRRALELKPWAATRGLRALTATAFTTRRSG